jgi:metal-responsive CopG/Arc/MetJ family transcriptional regulator
MKAEYDFSNATRGAVVPQTGKTRITMYLDDAILEEFRERADVAGKGYQTMINDALREYLAKDPADLEETLRKVIREEMGRAARYQSVREL